VERDVADRALEARGDERDGAPMPGIVGDRHRIAHGAGRRIGLARRLPMQPRQGAHRSGVELEPHRVVGSGGRGVGQPGRARISVAGERRRMTGGRAQRRRHRHQAPLAVAPARAVTGAGDPARFRDAGQTGGAASGSGSHRRRHQPHRQTSSRRVPESHG
jgi:hypothetical protein